MSTLLKAKRSPGVLSMGFFLAALLIPEPVPAAPACGHIDPPTQIGTVDADAVPYLNEASGLAQSRQNQDVFWSHNDNGDQKRLYALNRNGSYLGLWTLAVPNGSDIEDIALGPGPNLITGSFDANSHYLFLADVGNNYGIWGCTVAYSNNPADGCGGCPWDGTAGRPYNCVARNNLKIWRAVEPEVQSDQTYVAVDNHPADTINVRFPDNYPLGQRTDIETLLLDPVTGDLLLVTKRSSPAMVYRAPFPQSTSTINALEWVANLPWGGDSQATGGDISADGSLIAIRRYGDVHIWQRFPGENLSDAFARARCVVSGLGREPQGEALALDLDNSGTFFTVSEKAGGSRYIPLYKYTSVITCGNNILESSEQCDDGNTISGDGCSSSCLSEGSSSSSSLSLSSSSSSNTSSSSVSSSSSSSPSSSSSSSASFSSSSSSSARSSSSFSSSSPSGDILDSDGDGISNSEEIQAGSDPLDRGSYPDRIKSPAYALWNGFLGMTNVLELVNTGNKDATASVALYKIDGMLGTRKSASIAPGSQVDLILNELPGFMRDSYGLIKIVFSGTLDGRLSYYRQTTGRGDFEFAFAVPFSNQSFGITDVSFNTFQPSRYSPEELNQVQNWLSIVNLASQSKSFIVKQYDQSGRLRSTRSFNIRPFSRRDLTGGHENGSSVVGLNEIIPKDTASPYLAQLIRYGGDAPADTVPQSYSFAYHLLAKAGNGRATNAPISNRLGAENWLEVVNTKGRSVRAHLDYYNSVGNHLQSAMLALSPHSQQHINASAILGTNDFGHVTIRPSVKNSIISQSMFYYRTAAGQIAAMYGSQGREVLGSNLHGSYNLFLDMENSWMIHNTTNAAVSISVDVGTLSGRHTFKSYNLTSYGSVELRLRDGSLFGTSANSYGVVLTNTVSSGVIFSEILRLKRANNKLEFIMPIPVR